MRIQISGKLRPFSHRPGVRFLVPLTTWEVQVFPSKLFFHNLNGGEKEEVNLPVKGPVKGFTALLDLQKKRIEIFGRGAEGYFRIFIDTIQTDDKSLKLPFLKPAPGSIANERLSFGSHKKQDWDLMQRRKDLTEILPLWYALAQQIPEVPLPKERLGTAALLDEAFTKQSAHDHFTNVFSTSFQGMLCPRLTDENHLGIIPECVAPKNSCPLGILHEGARQIRPLFFREEGDVFHILPMLPKEFHAGRFLGIQTRDGDALDLEWSKKEIKKCILKPAKSRTIHLKLPRSVRSFRVRINPRQKGITYKANQPVEVTANQKLFLDRFAH